MRIAATAAAVLLSVSIAGVSASAASETAGTGAVAPAVVLQSVIAGKVEQYDLQAAAAKRPVVLYFFPKAFTAG